MGHRKKTYPLSWHLVALVLAAMLPFFIFSALFVYQLVGYERETRERQLRTTSLSLATSVDQEIESSLRTLDALSASLNFKNRTLSDVHADLERIHKSQPTWLTLLLHSPEGKTLLNSRVSFKETLVSAAEPTTLLKLFATGKPIIGSIARGSQSSEKNRKWAFAVRVPVFENGQVIYALSAVITNEALQNIVQRSESPPDHWTRTVIDSEGTIAARSRNPQEFVGKKTKPAFYNLIKNSEHGIMRSTTLDGKEVYSAYNRSPISGWTVAVAVPTEVLDAPAHQSLLTVLGVGLLLLCTFGGVALFYARALVNNFGSSFGSFQHHRRNRTDSEVSTHWRLIWQRKNTTHSLAQ
jgi:hypothetical protein